MEPIAYDIITYGCKVNTYDTGLLQKRFSTQGFEKSDQPKVYILNTCAVTHEATKEALRNVRKIKSAHPNVTVVVTGCSAQVDTDFFRNEPGVDLIVANSHKGQIEELIKNYLQGKLQERVHKSNIFKKEDLEPGGGIELGHTRSFLKIQDGCNSFCTFCVIPFARGKSRSLNTENLVRRVNELYAQGVREVVLTGVHIGDYFDDAKPAPNDLSDLLKDILKFTQMPRLRLSSLEPIELTEKLLELYQDARMCPHFHMSIQSANTNVLKNMKRKYTSKEVEQSLLSIQKHVKNSFVGMDVIAGFPGETEEEFEDTYLRLSKLPWTKIHVFPYSIRPGTVAAKRPDHLKRETITQRASQLRALSDHRYNEMAKKQIGTHKKILLLNQTKNPAKGLSQDYWPVTIENKIMPHTQGQELQVEILSYKHTHPTRKEGELTGRAL